MIPKKGGFTIIRNEKNQLIPTITMIGWRVCIEYIKLNTANRKDHNPFLFIDQMLDKLAEHSHLCFLNGYSRYNQIVITPKDQEKTTFVTPRPDEVHSTCNCKGAYVHKVSLYRIKL